MIKQPVLMYGKGKISFDDAVTLGYYPSPYFYSGYIYLDVRKKKFKYKYWEKMFL